MTINIGGLGNLERCFVGDKEVLRIYANNKYAWPKVPAAKVEWLGSVVASGNTNTFPAHQPGDLLVVAAAAGTNSIPGLPAGFTSVLTNNSGIGLRIGYRIATSSKEAVGAWSGAVWNTAYAFRNANTSTPFGGIAATSDTKGKSPAITMQNTSGDAVLVYGFHNNATTGYWYEAPAGFTAKNSEARMGNLQKDITTSDGAITWGGNFGTVNFKNWLLEVLPEEGERPYLYDIEITYLPNYEVSFKALKGFMPADPSEEAFMFRCAEMPRDGYVGREFTKQWASNGYSKLNCTLADLYGDGNPANNAEMMKTISFQVTPKA